MVELGEARITVGEEGWKERGRERGVDARTASSRGWKVLVGAFWATVALFFLWLTYSLTNGFTFRGHENGYNLSGHQLTNVKRLGLGLRNYLADNDAGLPPLENLEVARQALTP